jgi:insertion element IS1 protein InsB
LKLWGRVEQLTVGSVMANHWKPYTEIVPAWQLLQTKAETYTVESFNALIRHYLARFRRRSKYYSKSEEMIKLTLKLFFCHWNKRKNIIDLFGK